MEDKYATFIKLMNLATDLMRMANDILTNDIIPDLESIDLNARLTGHTPDDIACKGAYAPCGHTLCAEFGPRECPDRSAR